MPIPDRQQQRREYLKKKVHIWANVAIDAICLLVVLLGTIVLTVLSIISLYNKWFFGSEICYLGLPLGFGVLAVGGVFICKFLKDMIVRDKKEATVLSHVPPVSPGTLSAEEILVRSSQEQDQEQSTVLLRAAENADTPAEELLRPTTQENPSEKGCIQ